ncbi:MAG: hypothetical protein R3C14_17815 [Caldilineaceae bacterium]
MTAPRHFPITEELLSAYIDDAVTEEERTLIESAIAADPKVAWQVESLRQTVHLLQTLPALALPRSFTLDEIITPQAAPSMVQKKPVAKSAPAPLYAKENWWQRLQVFFQGGSPLLRIAAAAFALLVVLLVGSQFFASPRGGLNVANSSDGTKPVAVAESSVQRNALAAATSTTVVGPTKAAPQAVAKLAGATTAETAGEAVTEEAASPSVASPTPQVTIIFRSTQRGSSFTQRAPGEDNPSLFGETNGESASGVDGSPVTESAALAKLGAESRSQGNNATNAASTNTAPLPTEQTDSRSDHVVQNVASAEVSSASLRSEVEVAPAADLVAATVATPTLTATLTITTTPTVTVTPELTATATITPVSGSTLLVPPQRGDKATARFYNTILPGPWLQWSHMTLLLVALLCAWLWWCSQALSCAKSSKKQPVFPTY